MIISSHRIWTCDDVTHPCLRPLIHQVNRYRDDDRRYLHYIKHKAWCCNIQPDGIFFSHVLLIAFLIWMFWGHAVKQLGLLWLFVTINTHIIHIPRFRWSSTLPFSLPSPLFYSAHLGFPHWQRSCNLSRLKIREAVVKPNKSVVASKAGV